MKTINTRDLYKRKCELESLRDAITTAEEELEEAKEALTALDTVENRTTFQDWKGAYQAQADVVTDAQDVLKSAEHGFGDEEKGELAELEELESEITDFMHGATMVPETDFEEYAREIAEDCCDMSHADRWPFTCIDWEQAAKELAMDYTEVTYQGDTYLVRA